MATRMCRRVSSNTTEVKGTPSSPEVFQHFTNFQMNHRTQRAGVMPEHWCGEGSWGTTNGTGKAAVYGGIGDAFGGGNESPAQLPGSVKL